MTRYTPVDFSDLVLSIFGEHPQHKPVASFPPYNVLTNEDATQLTIEIAVAGFKQEDLAISAESEKLVVRGKKAADMNHKVKYHHQGIAKRSFELKWCKSADYEVKGASLDDGMLTITLEKTKGLPQEIPIITSVAHKQPQLLTE